MADLKNFFSQLETQLGSGISILKALNLLAGNVRGFGFKDKVLKMARMIDSGSTFSEAMAKIGSPFGKMHITFIKFGEEAGCLDKVCSSLAEHAEKEERLSNEVFTAMLYPAFILMFAVTMSPVLQTIIAQEDAWTAVVPAVINAVLYLGVCCGLWMLYKFLGGGIIDPILVHIPLIGGIMQNLALSRFTRTLSIGLAAGVPIVQALQTAIDVSGNSWLQTQLARLPAHVEGGKPLGQGLENAGCLPGTLKEMIVVGEQSGKLPEMLEKTARYFEEEASNKVRMIMKILPAIIFLAVAVYVGYTIVQTFQKLFSGLSELM